MDREADVLERARAGDNSAWRVVVERLGPPVLGYARAHGIRDADDLLGDVLISVVRVLGRFSGGLDDLKAFALKVAHDRMADHHRRASTRKEHLTSDSAELDGSVFDPDPDDSLGRLLGAISPKDREAVFLRVVCGLSAAQTGKVIGCSAGAVRVRVHRAVATLRSALAAGSVTI
jgi:RNA polymerase sigma-70 factor, ECF subfamily